MNALLILVPFAAIFVVAASITAFVWSNLSVFLLRRAASTTSTTVHALALFAPWLLATIACLALASPDPFAPCHCTLHGFHHPHLCLAHPLFASSLVTPSLFVLGAWFVVVGPRLFRLMREVIVSTLWVQTIRRSPLREEDSVSFRMHDCGTPSAYTVGVWSPVITVDTTLWEHLSPEERRAVLHHEQGHIERRDGLTLFTLQLCMALSPIPFGARLLDAWKSAAEKACDLHAAAKLGDSASVAETLVSVEKIRGMFPSTNNTHTVPALGVVAGAELEARVIALLDSQPNQIDGSRLGNDVLAVFLMTLGAAALTVVWPGDTLHHAAETLLGLIVH